MFIHILCPQVIVYPTNNSGKRFGAVLSLVFVWLVSMVLASPMAVFSVVQPFDLLPSIILYYVCVENVELEYLRRIYSIGVIIVQYLVPVAIVSAAHARISRKLRNRMQTLQQRHMADASTATTTTTAAGRHHQQGTGSATKVGSAGPLPVSAAQKEKRRLARNRKRKTNLLLVMIAVAFALSWLPLNVYNVIADFMPSFVQEFDRQVAYHHVLLYVFFFSCAQCDPALQVRQKTVKTSAGTKERFTLGRNGTTCDDRDIDEVYLTERLRRLFGRKSTVEWTTNSDLISY